MKLVLQIALGVFLGTLASQFVMDGWHKHQANIIQAATEQRLAEQEKTRLEQADSIRTLFLKSQQNNKSGKNTPPAGFIPDDASPK
ncbi:MAG: hypothetical protein NTV43_08735 [Methylococcales bacterium]|nr:hypothetical protein [Methylococcales bacterium]